MADRLKGITLEIGGDTTKLSKALSGVNSDIKSTKDQLKDVERLLKLDPTNTELLRQKQQLLKQDIEKTSEKLSTLKTASEQAAKSADKYDAWKAAYDPIQKEITETSRALSELKNQQAKMKDAGEVNTDAYKRLSEEVKSTEKTLRDLKEQAKAVSDEFGNPISKESYDSLQREIIETEQDLKKLKEESRDFGSVFAQQLSAVGGKLEDVGGKISAVGDKISGAGTKLMPVTGAIVGAGTMAVMSASDMAESINKVEVAFGDASDRVMEFSETTLDTYGISKGTALDMASLFGDMATSMGLVPDEAATLSEKLVGLSGDLASFKNVGVDQAAQALKGIFTGETESLKSLGVVMTQDNLLQYAMSKGMIDTSKSFLQQQKEALACEKAYDAYTKAVKEHGYSSLEARDALLKYEEADAKRNEAAKASLDTLSQEELVMLRYNYVMDKTGNAHGDFARTSDGTANSMRVMQESLKEAAAAFGELLLPIITPIIQKITELIKWFTHLDEGQKKTILTIAGIVAAVAPVLIVIGKVVSAVGSITTGIGKFMETIPKIQGALKTFWGALAANPMILIIAAIVAVVAALVTLYMKCEWFRDGVNAIFAAIRDFFIEVWNAICGFFTVTIPAAWDSVVSFFQGIPDWWLGVWQSVANFFVGKWNEICAMASQFAGQIQDFFNMILDYIHGVFEKDWTEVFGPVLGGILNTFFATFSGIWDSIKQVLDGVIDIIRGAFTGDWERVWDGVKEIFSGIFTGLEAIAEAPLNGIIGLLNMIIDGANWCIEKLNQIPGVNIDTFGDIPFLARGGTVYSGSAVVGDAGPEILTVSGGKATVTPLTGSGAAGGAVPAVSSDAIRTFVEVNFGGSLSQLAAVLQPAIVAETQRLGGSFTR